MNGNESTASNGKQLDANRDDRDAFKRAQDAYVAAYGIANKHGSDSPEFEKGFEEFEVALTAAVVSFISTPAKGPNRTKCLTRPQRKVGSKAHGQQRVQHDSPGRSLISDSLPLSTSPLRTWHHEVG